MLVRLLSAHRFLTLLAAVATLALAACTLGTPGSGEVAQPVQGRPAVQGTLPAVVATAVAPALVLVPTPTARPTLAPTVVPTATPLHPLTIEAMRGRDYAGGELVVEQTLAPGVNYSRQIVSYRSEGLKIYALLTVPRGARPAPGWPVVVFNHGFIPPAQYRTTERYIAYTDAFSRNGYILLRPDYRGHGSSEGAARGGYSSPDYVVDVLNALEAVRNWPEADPNRVGMWGHSMGGYITLRSMVVSNAIKAGVIWGGVVGSYPDMLYNWGNPPATAPTAVPNPGAPGGGPGWRNQLAREFGLPDQNPGFWASISANTYLADLSGPVQLHHGAADSSVPVRMSVTLERQIREAGGPVELFVYPGDNHDISGNLGTALNRSVAFFDTHVKRWQPG